MDEKAKEIHDKLKRLQLGDYLDLEDVDEFEGDKDYLRAVRTLFSEVIDEAVHLTRVPSVKNLEEKKEYYGKKLKELYVKKEEREVKGEKFRTTELLEEHGLSQEQTCLLYLLMAKRGVGVCTHDPGMIGEVLIMALNLLLSTDFEDARMNLTHDSKLISEDYITLSNPNKRSSRHWEIHALSRGRRSREKLTVEEVYFEVPGWWINTIYGDECGSKKSIEKERDTEDSLLSRSKPEIDLSDVVLPEDILEDVMSLLEQYRNSSKFMDEWNMKSILGDRQGLNLLLSGAPGTGKTMLAKALANELDTTLNTVSFADMVDSWYGNTEKNAQRMFHVLKEAGSILLIDEADAILQHRSPSRSSCDRSENRVINIVLQELENHCGLVIFTTNLAMGLDRAMERRMDLKIELPTPGKEARKKIWEYHIPKELPLADDVDIGVLSEKYEFTGGQIRNAVLTAARTTMRKGLDSVSMDLFIRACQAELKGSEVMNFYMSDKQEDEVRGYT